ncbi:MAG: DUF192 domain-containing protein, partial [Saprospiraceae bacterium]|nr:DUF192 domain-containing protein [Saprospiraceae bacterium]
DVQRDLRVLHPEAAHGLAGKDEQHAVIPRHAFTNHQAQLLFRESMPRDHGMLFIFSGETMRSFWMKNTKIPLDIIYFNKDLELVSVANARPCRTSTCGSYPSDGPAMYVLELNAGLADELGLAAGDRLEVHLPGR